MLACGLILAASMVGRTVVSLSCGAMLSLAPATDSELVKPVDPKVFAELRPRMSIIELVDKQEPWWFDRAW